MSTWDNIDSDLWGAKGYIDDAVELAQPGPYKKDALTDEEKDILIPTKGLGVTLGMAMKPPADEIIPGIDEALVAARSMKTPTARVTRVIAKLQRARDAFVECTIDPSKWKPEAKAPEAKK